MNTDAQAHDSPVDSGLFDDLMRRGLLATTTDPDALKARLAQGPIRLYVGFDPTADSLHAGNMVGLMMLRRFQEAGHHVYVLAGGATGMIGDPSGRSSERNLLDDDGLAANLAGIMPQLQQFVDFARQPNPARLVNNADWTKPITFLEFLRDVGKHVTVNQMLAKDSVKGRIESEHGISYTEFSYQLIQAHDFYWLHAHEGLELQGGGSDQWGNVVAGVDLIRRKTGNTVHALTWPLLTKPDGSKYGKTAGGETMWLGAHRMTPYRFYQSWIQVDDGEIGKLFSFLTMLPVEEIETIVAAHNAEPHRRHGQQRLAYELTALVHGADAAQRAQIASSIVFGGGAVSDQTAAVLRTLIDEIPTVSVTRELLERKEANAIDLVRLFGFAKSNGEATRLLAQGGISVNDEKISTDSTVGSDHLLHGEFLLVRRGKKHLALGVAAR